MTNILQRDTTQQSLLDGVGKIKALLGEYWDIAFTEGNTAESHGDEANAVLFQIYSAIEALLEAQRAEYEARIEANRKQVLLGAAEYCDSIAKLYPREDVGFDKGYSMGVKRAAEQFRRMALEPTGVDKGEG